MHTRVLLLAAWLAVLSRATPLVETQVSLGDLSTAPRQGKLHGRFLHITDIHPDPHYLPLTNTNEEHNCHRGHGPAGPFGAQTTECDTPFSLVNATFAWIDANLADSVDFVLWTGDSARHDSDERIPRTHEEVLDSNARIAGKFLEIFHKDDEGKTRRVPVVPTFGNNDILPHNILLAGPNKWLRYYRNLWNSFIPEEQRHGFERGGWFYKEVIPNKLAVFSLNTLYFFSNNAGVDGCEMESEPGYEHMEWLRIQLQFIRDRGMKAMLIGHVPPARTDSKRLWDESCWQKYTLWLKQYRDVVVGGFYGHMNIDHFVLQDTRDVDLGTMQGISGEKTIKSAVQEEFHVASASSYLKELREDWMDLPDARAAEENSDHGLSKKEKKDRKKKRKEMLHHIGGPFAERYQVTHISPSVVPNYFPTLRIFEYNTTGLEDTHSAKSIFSPVPKAQSFDAHTASKSGKHRKGKHGDKNRPKLTIPEAPTEGSPPGPAYSPQTYSLLNYQQFFANLTWINELEATATVESPSSLSALTQSWMSGDDLTGNNHTQFTYEIEYDTRTDRRYKLKDLSVLSWLKLAHRIGKLGADNIPPSSDTYPTDDPDTHVGSYDDWEDIFEEDSGTIGTEKYSNNKHGGKKDGKDGDKPPRPTKRNKLWKEFVRRAFVSTISDKKLGKFAYADGVLGDADVRGDKGTAPMQGQEQVHDEEI